MLASLAFLALAAAPDQAPRAARTNPRQQLVTARGRASVRILRPFRLEAGSDGAVPGAQRREAQLANRDGTVHRANLVEFE